MQTSSRSHAQPRVQGFKFVASKHSLAGIADCLLKKTEAVQPYVESIFRPKNESAIERGIKSIGGPLPADHGGHLHGKCD
jgi:hypothetical protein